MVDGIDAWVQLANSILALYGNLREALERRKERRSDSEDAKSSDEPIRVTGKDLAELEWRADIVERVEQLERQYEEERFTNTLSVLERSREALADKEVPGQLPDLRWLSVFAGYVQYASTDELQDTWARVLAGETEQPGSISVRTLHIVSHLDQSTAWLFRRLCSLSIGLYYPDGTAWDVRVPLVDAEASPTALRRFGLAYGKLAVLNEYGLINPNYGSWFDYQICIAGSLPRVPDGAHNGQRFIYQGQRWGLLWEGERELAQEFRVPGITLTVAGVELSRVVEPESVPNYDVALSEFFNRNGLTMARNIGGYLEPWSP